ncbi:glycosyltransferase [Xenorhabdus bovienii]|uniref:Putative glycosyltransferase n=1 Tax=Xenorhabdus bovienii str. kraussei Becker Underwood TaxID=1398204 RepID=A0A077PWY0_XENBV|nr:glycosyltransferase [Xenorhabdus bovienii]CDH25633.1 putative glycosyltransferase [Xenorhabdus bovienii str. kraussei Becker Underwood]
MKILIYGEYSGYARSLSKGFKKLGLESSVFSFSGDGWKSIDGDFQLRKGNNISKLIQLIKLIPKLLSFDYILIMNPSFMRLTCLGPLILLMAKLKKIKIILLCAGDDVEFMKQGLKGNLDIWPYMDIELPKNNSFQSLNEKTINYIVAKASDKIVPVMYDYAHAWRLSSFAYKVSDTIPLACDGDYLSKINKIEPTKKIVIMHGINREDFKGTKTIKKALTKIKDEFGDSVEIIYPEKLPLKDYLMLMKTVDIAIDQTKCYSYGMNAIYSMMAGHITLAPAKDECLEEFQINSSPIVSITNEPDVIYAKIKNLILSKNTDLNKLKIETRNYAVEIHSPEVIAYKFIKLFNSI